MSGLPVPTGTPSHLDRIFSRMYSPYSRDPRPVSAITWSVNPTVGSAYLTIAGATAALVMSTVGSDTRVDTFDRPDQSGWGTASDGHVWTPATGGAAVSGGHGVYPDGETNLYLGPNMTSADQEALVRWQATDAGDGSPGPVIFVRSETDNSGYAYITTNLDGSWGSGMPGSQDVITNDNWRGLSPLGAGVWAWMRVRALGTTYYARAWVDGDAEPSSWQFVVSESGRLPTGRAVGLTGFGVNFGPVLFDHFSATTLPSTVFTAAQEEFNLAIDDLGHIPTLSSFKDWLTSNLTSFFGSGFTVSWASGFDSPSLGALVLVEGFTQSDA